MRIALLLALAACSFPTRSGDFACATTADCEGGRVCEHELCVVGSPQDAALHEDAAPTGAGSGSAGIDAATLTCDATNLTCSGETIVMSCGSACWIGCAEAVSETTAAARCTGWGGQLTPLRTSADAACFQQVSEGDPSWSGLTQLANQTSVGAGWSWDGDHVTPPSIPWSSGEPNDSDDVENGQEQCAYVDGLGQLSDKVCTTKYPFACKR